MNTIAVRGFRSEDAVAFRRLNEEWIRSYFTLEPKDEEVLTDPEGMIIARGGEILIAERDVDVIGCCALLWMTKDEFELAKMAVAEHARQAGVGRLLIAAALDRARRLGARRLYLETNKKLVSAIHLYETSGFVHLPPHRVPVSPYARVDVYMEMLL